ncbi:hypothetical protein D3C79_753490 [compost metagenome]
MADEGVGDRLPVSGRLIPDPDDLHAWDDASLGHDGRRTHLVDHRLDAGDPDHEHQPEGEQGEQEVRHGTGRDYGHPRPDALVIECLRLFTGFELVDPTVQHLDVATERDQGQHIFGAILADTTPDSLAKTDGETFDLDATATGYPEVAELMHRHQQAEGDDKGAEIPQDAAHQWTTSKS